VNSETHQHISVVARNKNQTQFSLNKIKFKLKFCDKNRGTEQGNLSKFPNRNCSLASLNKLTKKINHTMNEAAVLKIYTFSGVLKMLIQLVLYISLN